MSLFTNNATIYAFCEVAVRQFMKVTKIGDCMLKLTQKSWFLIVILVSLPCYGLEFSHRGLDGKEYKLSDYKGKWVIVNYWATWCPPCIEEIPALAFFHEQHHKHAAVVLGVNIENASVAKITQFLRDYNVTYPVLLADPNADTPFGPITAMPTTFIISPTGQLMKTKIGRVDIEFLEQAIKSLGKGPNMSAPSITIKSSGNIL